MLRLLNDGVRSNQEARDPVALSQELLHAAREDVSPVGLERLARLSSSLHRVVLAEGLRTDNQRLAFWLNVYNALSRHAVAVSRARGSLLSHLGLFRRFGYSIDANAYTLDVIEHGLLRGNRRPPLSLRRLLLDDDSRLRHAPSIFDARIHFALNCGAKSCPPIRSYHAEQLDAQLDLASRAYIESETQIDREHRTARLPRLCKYYASDFGDRLTVLRFVARHLPAEQGEWLRRNEMGVSIKYRAYDWSITQGERA